MKIFDSFDYDLVQQDVLYQVPNRREAEEGRIGSGGSSGGSQGAGESGGAGGGGGGGDAAAAPP